MKELMCNWQQQQQQAKKNIAFTCKIEKVKNASIFYYYSLYVLNLLNRNKKKIQNSAAIT